MRYTEARPNRMSLICPICQRQFIVDDSTNFYILGGWTCSLNCFNEGAKILEERKKQEEKQKLAEKLEKENSKGDINNVSEKIKTLKGNNKKR